MRSKLLSWLSDLQPEDDLERIYRKRHSNTGIWFIESEQLRGLLQASNHCLLWCFGLRMFSTLHFQAHVC